MTHTKLYFFTIGIIITHTISPMLGPFIKDVLPHIAQHLDLVSQSRFVGRLCRAGCSIDTFLFCHPTLCSPLSSQDYAKILVHYAQNNTFMFRHIMTHENNYHKEQRVNVLTFFGYLKKKEVDLEIMKNLKVNMRAYQALAKRKKAMSIDPALFCKAAHKNHYIVVYIFIRNNMNVSYQDEKGNTALLLSIGAKKSNKHVIDLLLSHGADINHANQQQRTPLHLAAWYGHYHTVRKLIMNKASIEVHDSYGDTPLQDALFQKHFKIAGLLLKNHADINSKDIHGHTALHIAAQKGNINTLKFLIQNGAFINCKNHESRTPLHLAVWDNQYHAVQLLLKHGALANEKDLFGDTPLHDAIIRNNQKIARLLLINGADSTIKNNAQQTPLNIAKRRHSSKMIL